MLQYAVPEEERSSLSNVPDSTMFLEKGARGGNSRVRDLVQGMHVSQRAERLSGRPECVTGNTETWPPPVAQLGFFAVCLHSWEGPGLES